MIATQLLIFLVSLLHFAVSAPVTVWETATAITNADGSLWSYDASSTSPATAAATVAASAVVSAEATASASSTSTSTSTSTSVWSKLATWISDKLSSSSSSSTSTSTSTSSSSSSSSSWLTLFKSLFSDLTDSSSSTASSSSAATVATSSASAAAYYTSTTSKAATTTSSTSTSSGTGGIYDAIYDSSESINTTFAKAILDIHNEYRALHGVGDLSWAEGPYAYAKSNADSYDCSGVLTHTHGQYGENLAAGFSSGPAAVTAWYEEGDTFNYTSYNEYNHFTQVVWKASTKLGCAYKDCSSTGWGLYIVCEYSPVGNVIGEEEENVLPLVSS